MVVFGKEGILYIYYIYYIIFIKTRQHFATFILLQMCHLFYVKGASDVMTPSILAALTWTRSGRYEKLTPNCIYTMNRIHV